MKNIRKLSDFNCLVSPVSKNFLNFSREKILITDFCWPCNHPMSVPDDYACAHLKTMSDDHACTEYTPKDHLVTLYIKKSKPCYRNLLCKFFNKLFSHTYIPHSMLK